MLNHVGVSHRIIILQQKSKTARSFIIPTRSTNASSPSPYDQCSNEQRISTTEYLSMVDHRSIPYCSTTLDPSAEAGGAVPVQKLDDYSSLFLARSRCIRLKFILSRRNQNSIYLHLAAKLLRLFQCVPPIHFCLLECNRISVEVQRT